ncbi:MAG: prolyl oligopeptidase family serine peptidase, partial [Planctomycetota bacterium]
MNFERACLVVGVALTGAGALAAPPETEARPVTDDMHGTAVVDPYRWLEGDNSDPTRMGLLTEEVAEWTDAQNAYLRSTLDPLSGRSAVERRVRELLESGSMGTPRSVGDYTFYTKQLGAQPQPVLYVGKASNGANGGGGGVAALNGRVLLDPATVDTTGLTSLDWYTPSQDGSLVAFGMSRAGDENSTLYILETATGEWLSDEIPGKVSLSGWLPDNRSFVYSRLEDIDDAYSRTTAVHEIGRHWRQNPVLLRQRDVAAIYEGLGKSEDELAALATTWGPGGTPSRDGRWLSVGYWTGTSSNDVWVADLETARRTGELDLVPVLIGAEGRNSPYVHNGTLYMQTYVDAPNGKVVAIDPYNPDPADWVDVIPHRRDAILQGYGIARGVLTATYLDDASTKIELFALDGTPLGPLTLPGIGSASLSTAMDRTEAYLRYESFNEPDSIYAVDLAAPGEEPRLWDRVDVPFDGSTLEVRRVKYSSKDGTEVGMFIVHPKGVELNGENPTILYGYGGFNISMDPFFSTTFVPWFEAGGVLAVANLRGGGEKGLEWHRAGQLDRKQNVFDDFIAAGEYLVNNGYTRPEKLGIMGGSNGGLLTGAAVTQRPDLFGAVYIGVPLLDMLRFEKFLMARFWVPEYGDPAEAEHYRWLAEYSPYHNVEPGTAYPAALITAGENDTRVHPLHARKFAALLQTRTTADQGQQPTGQHPISRPHSPLKRAHSSE